MIQGQQIVLGNTRTLKLSSCRKRYNEQQPRCF